MASGLIGALRSKYPNAFIGWLIEPPGADLLANNAGLDQLIIWPKRDWQALWRNRKYRELSRTVRAFRAELRGYRFDQTIDVQGILKSAILARLSGAKTRIALEPREGSRVFATYRIDSPQNDRRIGAEYRFLVNHLGLSDHYKLDIALDATCVERVAKHLSAANAQRYAIICPFTTRAQKHWIEARWVALAQRLQQDGLRPVMLGGPDVKSRAGAQRIAALAPDVVNLVGATSLGDAAAAIARAQVVIGVDTGLTHLGIALNRPTLALFGSTRPYLKTERPNAKVLFEPRSCAPCHRHPTCGGRFDCMAAHEVEQVADEAQRLMAQ